MLNKIKFVLTLSSVFIFSAMAFSQEASKTKNENGIGSGNGDSQKAIRNTESTSNLNILAKAASKYTDAARKNSVEGTVRLRITFLASGEVGNISPVTSLPFGLTEQAIAAARQIKFTPARRNGVPITVVSLVEYSFSIYYTENDKELRQNAELLEMPMPEHPLGNNLDKIGGNIKLELFLNSDGSVQVIKVFSELPKEFEQKAIEAASKIKFKPAIHKNGKVVTQTKEIEYEFKAQKN